MAEKRELGLKAVHSARAERGQSKFGKIDGRVWLVAGGAVITTLVVAYLLNDRTLSSEKEEILSQQRAAVSTVGAEWYPLRDRLEKMTLDLASHFDGDKVDVEAAKMDFRSSPGLYLRLRVNDARDTDSLRKHAKESAKDAFTGCLLREPNAALARGDTDAGTGAEQPWNLHRAYSATRVMTDEWANEVKAADDKDRLRVFRQQYDKAKRDEIPLAIDIVKRAQFFLLVLDEDVPEARDLADGGPLTEEALQQVPHPARVHIVNLRTGAEIARLRKTAEADFQFVGERAVRDPETLAAMKRQVNNCALAQQVWSALRPTPPSADEPSDAGVRAKDTGADAGR
ncbi:MAG TPA: hypothetical protein VLT33_04270 [Labilithrix sp.]|nr:hypothetical protein [Labilithrix sp.]